VSNKGWRGRSGEMGSITSRNGAEKNAEEKIKEGAGCANIAEVF
jgi:hypothetical protein